jgi:hypothetical protein
MSLSQITVKFKVFSNRCPFQILRSMPDLLVSAYVNDIIGRQIEKVKNGHQ